MQSSQIDFRDALRSALFSPGKGALLTSASQVPIRVQVKDQRAVKLKNLRHELQLRGLTGLSANTISDSMSEDSETASLLAMDSGVRENWLLKEHVLRIFELLPAQEKCWLTSDLSARLRSQNIDVTALFPVLMVLHDIGKPLAARDGVKWRQHEYTGPIQKRKLRDMGYTPDEINLADVLVDNDWIGDYLQGHISFAETIHGMETSAQKAGLSDADYFRLQMIFYASDAGSYPYVASNVLSTDRNGCMEPQGAVQTLSSGTEGFVGFLRSMEPGTPYDRLRDQMMGTP